MANYGIDRIVRCLEGIGDNVLAACQFGSTVSGDGPPRGDLDILFEGKGQER